MAEGPLGAPRLTSAGPLTKEQSSGTIMFTSAFHVTEEFGLELENDDARARAEDRVKQVMGDAMGVRPGELRRMDLTLSPAGNVVGVRFQTDDDMVVVEEARNAPLSVEQFKDGLQAVVDTMGEVRGFRVPVGAGAGMGEPTDEPIVVIEAT